MKTLLKILAVLILLGILVGGAFGYYIYQQIYTPNVYAAAEPHQLFIPTGATFSTVSANLTSSKIIKNKASFEWVAARMNYPNKIYPGRYLIEANTNNRELVQLLRSGKQTPLNVTINNIRTKGQLYEYLEGKLEAEVPAIRGILEDSTFLVEKGFTEENIISLFIADTYQFNWNTSAEEFVERMHKEYTKFWSEERKMQARKQELKPLEVTSLAAIVQEEVAKNDEMPRVAGVYLNRLEKGMLLEADPTVKFALQDFGIRRLLFKHLEVESPYNTYKNKGLPPGPICIPSKLALEAVLAPETHDYLFFCAKEDFSGYHNFAATYKQHKLNAKRYHKALNERGIK